MRVAETGLTMAEYFREESHKDVLLFIGIVVTGGQLAIMMWADKSKKIGFNAIKIEKVS